MINRSKLSPSLLTCLVGLVLATCAAAQENVKKIALVVGVSEYQKDGLTNLRFAHKDARDLAEELKRSGFSVTELIGKQATKERFEAAFDNFIGSAADLGKSDVVLVSFSGHGVQKAVVIGDGDQRTLSEIPFVCLYDTLVSNPDTMVSLNSVIERLKNESGASSNLLIVDACRNNPDKGAKTLDGSTVKELPTKISILFSSSPGQKSYESEKIGQGVFTHVLLQGLRGQAANSRDQIDWLRLAAHCVSEVPLAAPDLVGDPNLVQRPNLIGNSVRSPILASKPSSVRPLAAPFGQADAAAARKTWAQSKGVDPELKNSLGMELKLIPPGEFMMGSVESVERVISVFPRENPKSFANEHPVHPVRLTQPFMIGAHEVTQDQFQEFVRATGYRTSAEVSEQSGSPLPVQYEPGTSWKKPGDHSSSGDCPVCIVSWKDAKAFCDWLSKKENRTYRLPTQAEWEYACRAGTESMYWTGNHQDSLAAGANVPDRSLVGRGNYDLLGYRYNIGIPDLFDGGWFTMQLGRGGLRAKFESTDVQGRVVWRDVDWQIDDQIAADRLLVVNSDPVQVLQVQELNGNTFTLRPGQKKELQLSSMSDYGGLYLEAAEKPRSDFASNHRSLAVIPGWVYEFDIENGDWVNRESVDSRTDRSSDGVTIRNRSPTEPLSVGVFGKVRVTIPPGQARTVRGLPSVRVQFDRIDASDGFVGLAPVGSLRPNAFGLYDMIGNVWEWCEDGYDPERPYTRQPGIDPLGPANAELKVIRGGCLW